MAMITEGDRCPDFELPGTDGEDLELYRLSELAEEGPVVLTFYLFDFSPACTEELCSIRDLEPFEHVEATTVLGISPDGVFSHREFARRHNVGFRLLSDTDGSVAEEYGVLQEEYKGHRNIPRRSVFVMDSDRTATYTWVAGDQTELPDYREVEDAVMETVATDADG